MGSSLIENAKNFFSPTEIWACHYWRMDYPDRVAETFPTQVAANACADERRSEGYLALVRFEGTINHGKQLQGLFSMIASLFSTLKGSTTHTLKDE